MQELDPGVEPGLALGVSSYEVLAYPPIWRILAAALVAVSRASLPAIAVFGILLAEESLELRSLVAAVAIAALLPGVAAWLIGRAFAAQLDLDAGGVVLRGRGLRAELPFASMSRVEPWAVPLPAPGLTLHLHPHRRFGRGLAGATTPSIVEALVTRASVPGGADPLRRTAVVFAAARAAVSPNVLAHPVAKFVVYALLPTAVIFNADQWIVYGGTLGQYYAQGLLPYLRSFVLTWFTVSIHLVLYASLWRGVAELSCWLAARVAPSHAARVRRVAEIGCLAGFYAGVPVLLAIRFLS